MQIHSLHEIFSNSLTDLLLEKLNISKQVKVVSTISVRLLIFKKHFYTTLTTCNSDVIK